MGPRRSKTRARQELCSEKAIIKARATGRPAPGSPRRVCHNGPQGSALRPQAPPDFQRHVPRTAAALRRPTQLQTRARRGNCLQGKPSRPKRRDVDAHGAGSPAAAMWRVVVRGRGRWGRVVDRWGESWGAVPRCSVSRGPVDRRAATATRDCERRRRRGRGLP